MWTRQSVWRQYKLSNNGGVRVDELRLILLGIGLLIIGLIYAWGMRAQIRDRLKNRRREPGLDEVDHTGPTVDQESDVWRPEVRVKSVPPADPPKARSAAPESTQPKTVPQQPAAPKPAQPKPAQPKPAQLASEQTLSEQSKPGAPVAAAPQSATTQPAPTAVDTPAKPEAIQPGTHRRAPQPASAPKAPPTPKSAPAKTNTWNVALTLIAPEQRPYTGHAVKVAAEQQGLVLAKRGVWECLTGDGSGQMVFGIAHLREPGTFDPAKLSHLRTPGLLLFMPLPGPLNAVNAVDLMIEQAGQLQRRLGGVLCDERRHRLTAQSLIQLRARADEFDRKMQ